jgi:hypothetical protein
MEYDPRAQARMEVCRFIAWLDMQRRDTELAMRALDKSNMGWTQYAKRIEPYEPEHGEIRFLDINKARIGHWVASARAIQWLARREDGSAFGVEIAEYMGVNPKQICSQMETCRRYGLVTMKLRRCGRRNSSAHYNITELGREVSQHIYWVNGKPHMSQEVVN